MTEAAFALAEQKNQSMGEMLSRLKAEKEEQREQQIRLRKKEEEVKKQEIQLIISSHHKMSYNQETKTLVFTGFYTLHISKGSSVYTE